MYKIGFSVNKKPFNHKELRRMRLSPREVRVLTLVARGYSDKEIGVELKISERTVQTHMMRIILKLDARNRVNAAVLFFINNPNLLEA